MPKDSDGFMGKNVDASGADYIQVSMSADMTSNISADDPILFDTVMTQRGELSLDAVTNVGRISGLKAGSTYLLQATARHATHSGGFVSCAWYNVTGSAYIGTGTTSYAQNNTGTNGEISHSVHIFTPAVDTAIEYRITGFASNTADIDALNGAGHPVTWAQVVELG